MTSYTKDETLILLSFAMANYGSNFAHWLRNKLMRHYNLFSESSVYLDSVSARSGNSVNINSYKDEKGVMHSANDRSVQLPSGKTVNIKRGDELSDELIKKLEGTPLVSPDRRGEAGALMPIGARRSDWKEMYVSAMDHAKVMVFVHTPDFQQSVWCMQEWDQFIDKNRNRMPDNKLHGIVLEFSDCSSLVAICNQPIKRIVVNKKAGNIWKMRDGIPERDFVLNDSDFAKLTNAIDKSVGGKLF